MDKYEFKISLNEINALIGERRFEEAANIADGIDWNHVKSAETLCRVSEVYKAIGEYDRSRDIMAIAHEREADNPVIIYALCELTIFLYGRDGLQSDLTLALQLMQDYQAREPENPKRLILQYKMYCVSPVSDQEKIAVLEQLHKEKPSARWDYELAELYQANGRDQEAGALGAGIQAAFPGSRYAEKAAALVKKKAQAPAGSTPDRAPQEEPPEERKEQEEPALQEASAEKKEAEEEEQAMQAAAELEERTKEEKAEENAAGEPAAEENTDLPIRTAEEQHNVDSIQNNVAEGMQDIYARPYDDKLEQETSGQYSMVMDEQEEPEPQVEGQLSISEVMAEWEKIRSDIRRANDEKRAQRIMEDTGSLMQDFDETARHGLLEDIEKGVARQRRQVRSGMYRMAPDIPEEEAGRRPAGNGRRIPERDPYRNQRAEAPVRRAPRPEPAPYRPDVQEPVVSPAEQMPGEDDTRVYRRGDAMEEARTRRWNSDEVRRAMAGQAQAYAEEPKEPYVKKEYEEPETAPAEEAYEEPKMAPAEEVYEEPEEAPAEEVYEEPEEAPAEEVYEEPEEAPAEEVYEEPEEAPAEEAYEEPEEAPAEEVYEEPEEASAEEVYEEPEEAPAEEVYEEPEETPAEEAYEEPEEAPVRKAPARAEEPARRTEQRRPRQEKKTIPAPQQPKREPAAAAGAAAAPGGKRPLSREERRLFGPFCRMRENVEQLTEALDQISLASSTGNLLILGNEATSDRVAKGILEITRKTDSNFTGKVAKVSGEALNRLSPDGIRKTFVKLESGALIVNKAAELAPKTMERLYHELEGREHGIILILVDGNKKMEQFRHENEKYLGSFTAVISVRPLDDKALVAYAKDYALSQDFSIDEFGQLALAQRISAMQTSTHQVTLKEVRDLVDEAIGYAEKKTPHTLIEMLSKRRYDENDRIIIHEKDFMHN